MRGLAAKLHHTFGRGSVPGRAFSDPVAHPGRGVVKAIEVETSDDRSVTVDEDEERGHAGILLIKQRLMILRESLINASPRSVNDRAK